MRFLFFLLFCFLLWMDSPAQSKENSFSPDKLSVTTYFLDSRKVKQDRKIPFSTIEVIDARFDSSKLGFIANTDILKGTKNQFDILKIKNGTAKGLENYLNDHYTSDSNSIGFGLLIVLKKFWVTSTRSHDYQKYNSSNIIKGESRIIAKWELYISRGDQYLPFRRIDTTIESTQSVKQLFKDNNAAAYSRETIYTILNKLVEQFDYSKALKIFGERQTRSLAEIKELNNTRFNIPLLTDKTINKGVYLTFDDFIKNNPSIKSFKEKKQVRGIQYITDSTDNPITLYWGYADNYVKVGRYGSETIFRTGNTFDFFEKISLTSYNSYTVPVTPYPTLQLRGSNVIWVPYQVDMETGNFY